MTPLEDAIRNLTTAALLDDKTPLGNAIYLNQTLNNLNSRGKKHVVMAGDLNGFKAVNTEHTYRGGDAAIQRVGETIVQAVKVFPETLAFRQSGDEFTLTALEENVHAVADALSRHLKRVDVAYEGKVFHVGMSFGWALADPTVDVRTWLTRAEDACKAAKAKGSGTVIEWTPELKTDVEELRLRCGGCGCAFDVKLPAAEAPKPSELWCPRCGRQGRAS